MDKVIVTGCGTDVGKTVVSAILVKAFQADYWKAIESGVEHCSDSQTIEDLTLIKKERIFSSAYSLKAPLSPHHAARLENTIIDPRCIVLPQTKRRLIIEGAGGVLVPISNEVLILDLFAKWSAFWIVVSRHYLGSINHTLLTLEALKQRKIEKIALVFNGEPNRDSEEAILKFSNVPCLGRLLPEKKLSPQVIQGYAELWKDQLLELFR